MKHGASRYSNLECRCQICTEANTARVALRRKERVALSASGLMPLEVPHGAASTYSNWGCQCEPCRKAGSDANRRRYLKRKGNLDPLSEASLTWRERARAEIDRLNQQIARDQAVPDAAGVLTRADVKPGDRVMIRGSWTTVVKANPKTVLVRYSHGMSIPYPYVEIQQHQHPPVRPRRGP